MDTRTLVELKDKVLETVKTFALDFYSRGLRNELSKVEVGAAVAIGIPLLLLNPIVLPHLLTLVMNMKRIKGSIRGAYFTVNWKGHIFFTIHRLSLTNPKGFDEPQLLSVRYVQVGVSPWSLLFTRYIYIPHIWVRDVKVWVEQEKIGLNAAVFAKQMKDPNAKKKKDDDEPIQVDESTDEAVREFILRMIGMANPNDMLQDAAGKLKDPAKEVQDSITGVAEHAESILRGGFNSVSKSVKDMQDGVDKAGGIDKWASNQVGSFKGRVEESAGSLSDSAKADGIMGVVTNIQTGVTDVAAGLNEGQEDFFLQQTLHRTVMGCYEEDMKASYIWVGKFIIEKDTRWFFADKEGKAVWIDVGGMFPMAQAEGKQVVVSGSRFLLTSHDLRPHPDAKRQRGLPSKEFSRRVQVIVQHVFGKENRTILFELAHAGTEEAVKSAIPAWLMPKGGDQNAVQYVGDLAMGFTNDVTASLASITKSAQKLVMPGEEGEGVKEEEKEGEEKEGKKEGKKGEGGQPGTPASPLDQVTDVFASLGKNVQTGFASVRGGLFKEGDTAANGGAAGSSEQAASKPKTE